MLIGQRRVTVSVGDAHPPRQTAIVCLKVGLEQRLTLDDVSQPLGVQQVFETSHLLLQLAHQAVVGVLVDHCVAADLLGTISVPRRAGGSKGQELLGCEGRPTRLCTETTSTVRAERDGPAER